MNDKFDELAKATASGGGALKKFSVGLGGAALAYWGW